MLIELQDIKPTYMSLEEVQNSEVYLQTDVKFEAGKKYLIIAQSGHGKSSILNFIYGSNANFEGTILYDERKLENEQVFDLRKENLSYVFQDYKLFPEFSVWENIQLKNALTQYVSDNQIDEWLTLFALDHKKEEKIKNLSLGQRQRVAIIRALCQPFSFLLLDEPFSHIDPKNSEVISGIIEQRMKEQNASLIMTALQAEDYFSFDTILHL